MYRKFILSIILTAISVLHLNAQDSAEPDTIRNYVTPSVTVTATKAIEKISPVPFYEIQQDKIQAEYTVEDIPIYLSNMPSIIAYSVSGNGIGYSTLTMRGFDQRRISTLVNGIPQNDPEEHNVYWIDFPDLAESLESIQIQRGAGLVNYGASAIGGSINLSTSNFANKKGVTALIANGWQEYSSESKFTSNVSKFALEASSGLIDNKYALYGRLSRVNSWGYRDHSYAFLNSYFLGAAFFGDIVTTQINAFGGPFEDGLAYVGLPKVWVKDKSLRRANLDAWEYDTTGQIAYSIPQIELGVEEFSQPHYEILNEVKLSDNVRLKSSLFYYTGKGYFDFNGSWADKSILRMTPEFGFDEDIPTPTETIIRAFVEKRQWGWLPTLQWNHKDGQFTIGGEARIHRSEHWGRINFANNLPSGFNPDFKIYSNNAERDIFSLFAREQYYVLDDLLLSAEAQSVISKYRINNEKAGERYTKYYTVQDDSITGGENIFDISYLFFNPRLGLTWTPNDDVSVFASAAFTSSEPTMLNLYAADYEYSSFAGPLFHSENRNGIKYYDFSAPLVKPEKLLDIELGSTYSKDSYRIGLNAYCMEYFDELVKSGQIDIFGSPVDGNASRSRHYGIEFLAGADIIKTSSGRLYIDANFTLSRNKIIEYNYELGSGKSISLSGNDISGFPDFMMNARTGYNIKGFSASILAKYVGSYKTDNFGDLKALLNDPVNGPYLRNNMIASYNYYDDNDFDGYFLLNADFSYSLENFLGAKTLRTHLRINNILNKLYAAGAEGKNFFPAAERNVYISLEYGF